VHLGPHRWDLTSSSFVSESRPGGFLHAPSCGLASSRPGFPARDYPGKTLETTWYGFDPREGFSPCLVLWRGTCPSWLSPMNSGPSSTQILTQHYSVQSETISQLETSGTTSTCMSPQLSPFELSQHPRTGSVHMPHHTLTSQMELRAFVKPPA
jgi:hypothetical protein